MYVKYKHSNPSITHPVPTHSVHTRPVPTSPTSSPYAKVEGSVWLDGRSMRADDIQFVPQFDDFFGVKLYF